MINILTFQREKSQKNDQMDVNWSEKNKKRPLSLADLLGSDDLEAPKIQIREFMNPEPFVVKQFSPEIKIEEVMNPEPLVAKQFSPKIIIGNFMNPEAQPFVKPFVKPLAKNVSNQLMPVRCSNRDCLQFYDTVAEADENKSNFERKKGEQTCALCSSYIEYYSFEQWYTSDQILNLLKIKY